MGMSASQARLLYLTTQLNNLSLKGQTVSDAKARLALDTQAIQEKYIRALNSSRLYMNTNIFAAEGEYTQSEYLTLANLQANGLLVSDGSKILGYSWERIPTGETELIQVGWEDDLTKPVYPTKVVESNSFEDPSPVAYGDISKMQEIVNSLGLTENDVAVKSYKTTVNGSEYDINAIAIKSQAGFEAVYEAMQNDIDVESGSVTLNNTLAQNYVFDIDSVDMSKYVSTGIPYFTGIFDGNGVTIKGINGTQGLFRDVYGVVKNVNIDGANISAQTDTLGAVSGYLGDGGLIENCNITNANIVCDLYNKSYDEGYSSQRCGVGAVVGYNNGSIRNTSAQGVVNVPHADDSFGYIGGFIGANVNVEYGCETNIVENCYSDVNVVLGSASNYSNSINAFIGDDTYESIVKNCISLGSITNLAGNPINGTDLANWGPVIESNLYNMVALDTRNNNDVLYWETQDNPSFTNGSRTQPVSLRSETTALTDGSEVYNWLNPGTEGYAEQAQASAMNNNLPVLNLTALQSVGLTGKGEKEVPDTSAAPIGYQQKPKYEEVPKYKTELVKDADFSITSLALEEGLRNGSYTLVTPTDDKSTQAFSINGLFYETISLSSCSIITDKTEDDVIKKAEAEYERDMAEVQMQDKRYEMDQKKIDTQYQAYLAEEESLKSVLKKNVDNSYKTFSA